MDLLGNICRYVGENTLPPFLLTLLRKNEILCLLTAPISKLTQISHWQHARLMASKYITSYRLEADF